MDECDKEENLHVTGPDITSCWTRR